MPDPEFLSKALQEDIFYCGLEDNRNLDSQVVFGSIDATLTLGNPPILRVDLGVRPK
jgi:hypothetical protein